MLWGGKFSRVHTSTLPHSHEFPQMLSALLEVMSFDGNEIYLARDLHPLLTGVPFHLLQSVYHQSVPIGIRRAGGQMLLKPHPDTKVEQGEDHWGRAGGVCHRERGLGECPHCVPFLTLPFFLRSRC